MVDQPHRLNFLSKAAGSASSVPSAPVFSLSHWLAASRSQVVLSLQSGSFKIWFICKMLTLILLQRHVFLFFHLCKKKILYNWKYIRGGSRLIYLSCRFIATSNYPIRVLLMFLSCNTLICNTLAEIQTDCIFCLNLYPKCVQNFMSCWHKNYTVLEIIHSGSWVIISHFHHSAYSLCWLGCDPVYL